MIRLLHREQLDSVRWDQLISRTPNGLAYALSTFLDELSPGWSALVAGDYETVMPLTYRTKYGIRYLYQLPYLQQLGVFGLVDEDILAQFIAEAKSQFRFAEIHLNYNNPFPGAVPRQNFVLPLDPPYDSIASAFASVHIKNLKRAANAGLRYVISSSFGSNIDLNFQLYGHKIGSVKKQAWDAIERLSRLAPDLLICREVWKESELQASCVCFKDSRRIYFIMSSVTEAGKHYQANHFLVDQLIREFSGTPLMLDFEGSDLPGVADFYRGFGALNQPYYFLKWNHLPWPVRLLKK